MKAKGFVESLEAAMSMGKCFLEAWAVLSDTQRQ
jgi:hypothetical protein